MQKPRTGLCDEEPRTSLFGPSASHLGLGDKTTGTLNTSAQIVGFHSHPFADCGIEQVMRRKHIDVTKELKNDLKRKRRYCGGLKRIS